MAVGAPGEFSRPREAQRTAAPLFVTGQAPGDSRDGLWVQRRVQRNKSCKSHDFCASSAGSGRSRGRGPDLGNQNGHLRLLPSLKSSRLPSRRSYPPQCRRVRLAGRQRSRSRPPVPDRPQPQPRRRPAGGVEVGRCLGPPWRPPRPEPLARKEICGHLFPFPLQWPRRAPTGENCDHQRYRANGPSGSPR